MQNSLTKALICLCCLSLLGCGHTGIRSGSANKAIRNALIASFPFDGDARDRSRYHNDGMVRGERFVRGRYGQALRLNGTVNSYAYWTDEVFYHVSQPTVEAWFKVDEISRQMSVVCLNIQGAWADGRGYFLDVLDGQPRFVIGDESKTWHVVVGSSILEPNTWYHLVGTYDSNSLRIYVNGQLDGFLRVGSVEISYRRTPGAGPNPSALYVGVQHSSHESPPTAGYDLQCPLRGVVDEVRIYNRALSEAEIEALYEEDWD